MAKITTFLAYESGAEQAVEKYVSLFENARVGEKTYYQGDSPGGVPKGTVMTIEFWLEGVKYVAMNGGPHFKLTDAVSLSVEVETQAEVDRLADALSAEGGEEGPCGWVRDRWGLWWQVTPKILIELITSKDPATATRAMEAMLKMKRIDIAALKRAAGL